MKNQQTLVVAIAAVVIVVGGIVLYNQMNPQTPTTVDTGKKEVQKTPVKSTTQTTINSSSKPASIVPPVVNTITPAPQTSLPTVTYTSEGFQPKVLEVKLGKSVHFVNKSDRTMWVISTDSNLFDQGRSAGKNGTFDFTFIQTGAWNYKNLNYGSHTATIIVVP